MTKVPKAEAAALNRSHALATKGDKATAQKYLAEYLEGGGKATPAILTNLLYAFNPDVSLPAKSAKKYLDLALELARSNAAFLDCGFLENLCIVLNNVGRGPDSVLITEHALEQDVELTAGCYTGMTYGAWISKDTALMQRAADHVDRVLEADADRLGETPTVFDNTGALHLRLGNVAKAIAYVRLCKKYEYAGWKGIETSPDFAALVGNAEFHALFRLEPAPPVDIIVLAELDLEPKRMTRWRALSLTERSLTWSPVAPVFRGERPAAEGATEAPATVGALLDAMEATFAKDPATPSFLDIEGGLVSGFLSGQHSPRFHQDLATALRLASLAGAKGSARFVLPTEQAALSFAIAKGTDDEAPGWGSVQELLQDEAISARIVDAVGWVKAKLAAPELVRRAYRTQAEQFGVGPMNDTHRALLAAMKAVGAAALYPGVAALKAPNGRALGTIWSSPKALAAAIDGAEPLARVLGLELLSRVQPKSVLALAEQLARDESAEVRKAAVSAVAQVAEPAAITFLLASLADETVGFAAADALVRQRAKETNKRLLAALDAPLEPLLRATHLLYAIGKRQLVAAVPQLFALWSDHPTREVRKEAARALAFVGSAEVKAREQDLVFTLLGMGKALNGNDTRRRELLEITKRDNGGILRFEGLDVKRLQTLVDEGFIDLTGTQNDSPSAGDFFGLMKDHPEVTANGYAVSAKRTDYRVSIDSIEVYINEVPEDRRPALRQIFDALTERATNSESGDDRLHVWWT